jgi:cytochrome c553
MIRPIVSSDLTRAFLLAALLVPAQAFADPATNYESHCAACHGTDRLGGTEPALIPETLGRVRGIADVIAHGRRLTQMVGFADELSNEQIEALVAFIKTPLAHTPAWTDADIAASREMAPDYHPAAAPVFDADPMNITLVVEIGDHHVSVLDGDKLTVLDQFATPYAVHGGPKFSPDGRYVFIMSRDGGVQKYDIWSLVRWAGSARA